MTYTDIAGDDGSEKDVHSEPHRDLSKCPPGRRDLCLGLGGQVSATSPSYLHHVFSSLVV